MWQRRRPAMERFSQEKEFTSFLDGPHKKKWIFWVLLFFSILLFVGISLAGFFLFRVTNIEVTREENDMNLQYEQIVRILEFVKGKNLLILSTPFLEKQLMLKFPELSEVHVSKKFPQNLSVSVKTDPVIAKWTSFLPPKKEGEEGTPMTGFLSEHGLFFPNGPENAFSIVEKDFRENPIPFSSSLLPKESVAYLFSLKKNLESILGKPLVRAEFLRNAQELHFFTEEGMAIWIFLREEPQKQVDKLAAVMREKDIGKENIEYIDLRISRKVIYKPK